MRWLSKLTPLLIAAVINTSSAGQPSSNRPSEPRPCGYSVAYPANWYVVPSPDAPQRDCSLTLRPLDFDQRLAEDDVDIHTLYINGGSGGFDDGADAAGFELIDPNTDVAELRESELEHLGERVIYGRQGIITVPEPLNVGEYSGLRGYAVAGCHYEGGGYAGLCELPVAFLTNGHRWLSIEAGPGVEVFESVLNSVCLEAPPNLAAAPDDARVTVVVTW